MRNLFLQASVFWTSLNFIAVLYAENLTVLNSVMFLNNTTMSGWSQWVVSDWWLKINTKRFQKKSLMVPKLTNDSLEMTYLM